MTQPAETRVRVRGLQPVQLLAGLVGLVYLAIGILGFVVAGSGEGSVGAFSVNLWHNLLHLGVGVLGVIAALNSGFSRTFGWLLLAAFGLLFVWGLAITGVFASNPVSGLGNPFAIDTADNWLHLGTALAGLLIAVLPARKRAEAVLGEPAPAQPTAEPATEPVADDRVAEPAHRRRGLRNRFGRRDAAH